MMANVFLIIMLYNTLPRYAGSISFSTDIIIKDGLVAVLIIYISLLLFKREQTISIFYSKSKTSTIHLVYYYLAI